MNKYELLTTIAADFNIKRGINEPADNFKARIIYSVICRLSYASLWDNSADSTVSIQHFKNKVASFLKTYLEIYPEVKISENLPEEIFDLYLKTGNFYHKPNNISASIFSVTEQEKILFLRGITPRQKIFMSGAGFYLPSDYEKSFEASKFKNFPEMFSLQEKTLQNFWQEIISAANFEMADFNKDTEFLRMKPPFNRGYWQNFPISDGRISLARNGEFEPKNYYLYKIEGKKFFCSRLSEWRIYDEFFKSTDYKNYRGGI